MRTIGIPEREEKEQVIENLFEKNNDRKLSEVGVETNHASSGITECPNQDEPKHLLQDTS